MAPKSKNPSKPKVKKYHGYAVLLFIMGTLFPPLAVAARFGIGKDFWLNLLLTICGYIPGHCHNFYIQNVRNNKTNQRTPKWVQRYGLVDTSTIKRHEQRSQWAHRYNDRNPTSALDGQSLEEGQMSGPGTPERQNSRPQRQQTQDGLWREEDESFYNPDREGSIRTSESNGGRWHYPANFDNTLAAGGGGELPAKKKKKKKDRWARTEDAHSVADQKKRKKKSKNRSTVGDSGDLESTYSRRSGSPELDGPEDPNGASYGRRTEGGGNPEIVNGHGVTGPQGDEFLNHEF